MTAGSTKNRGQSGGGGGGGAGRERPAPAPHPRSARRRPRSDKAALDQLTQERKKPSLTVGGSAIQPGDNGLFNVSSATNGLPLPLLLALIGAVLLALIGGLLALRRRVPALGRLPLLSKIGLPRVPTPRERS